jgi:hypothetical protein
MELDKILYRLRDESSTRVRTDVAVRRVQRWTRPIPRVAVVVIFFELYNSNRKKGEKKAREK